MTRLLVFFAFIFLIQGCGDDRPKNVVSLYNMADIMWDVLRADELTEYYKLQDTSFSSFAKRSPYYNEVLKIHKIDQNTFRQSLEYYELRPELLQKIIDTLNRRADIAIQQQIKDTAQKQRNLVADTSIRKP